MCDLTLTWAYIQKYFNMYKLTEIEKELLAALKSLVEVMPQTYVHFPDQREAVKKAWAAIENAEKTKQ
jgi:hypothetical protein